VDVKHRWRDYRTAGGARPVADFIAGRSLLDRAEIAAAMKDVTAHGVRATARHLRGPLYEVRANGLDESYRLIFAREGRKGRVLLALVALTKKTQKTPESDLRLAERRLADWRARGQRD
jgi:phage-related protein